MFHVCIIVKGEGRRGIRTVKNSHPCSTSKNGIQEYKIQGIIDGDKDRKETFNLDQRNFRPEKKEKRGSIMELSKCPRNQEKTKRKRLISFHQFQHNRPSETLGVNQSNCIFTVTVAHFCTSSASLKCLLLQITFCCCAQNPLSFSFYIIYLELWYHMGRIYINVQIL